MSIQQTNMPGSLPVKKQLAPLVLSIIALALSGLGFICSALTGTLLFAGPTANEYLTIEVMLSVFGVIVCGGFGCIIGPVGALMGIVAGIVSIVKKRFALIWMSVLSVILGIASPIIVYGIYCSIT